MRGDRIVVKRRPYPRTGKLISIAFTEWGRFLQLGDVAANTTRFRIRMHPGSVHEINGLRYVSIHVLRTWVDQAVQGDRQDLAAELEGLIEWALEQEPPQESLPEVVA